MYKMSSAIDTEKHNWTFIGSKKSDGESYRDSLTRRVEKEAGIKIEEVEFLSDTFYHARLTDDNVNNIKRNEGQLLDFFTLREVEKLSLSNQTKQFIQKYGDLI